MVKQSTLVVVSYLLGAAFQLGGLFEAIGKQQPAYTVDWGLWLRGGFFLVVVPGIAYFVGRKSAEEPTNG